MMEGIRSCRSVDLREELDVPAEAVVHVDAVAHELRAVQAGHGVLAPLDGRARARRRHLNEFS